MVIIEVLLIDHHQPSDQIKLSWLSSTSDVLIFWGETSAVVVQLLFL